MCKIRAFISALIASPLRVCLCVQVVRLDVYTGLTHSLVPLAAQILCSSLDFILAVGKEGAAIFPVLQDLFFPPLFIFNDFALKAPEGVPQLFLQSNKTGLSARVRIASGLTNIFSVWV